MPGLRMTVGVLAVLGALLDRSDTELYGLEIVRASGLEPGTIYPILVAFENAGWLRSREEDVDPHREGRPRRRYYLLTPAGTGAAREALASTRRARRAAANRKLAW